MQQFERILLTGAAGDLGTVLRKGLAPLTQTLRLNDRAPIADPTANEEVVQCDLADMQAVSDMVAGTDAIVHFGGASRERVWQDVLDSTIRGSYHIYEAARKHQVKRIVYASSIHAVGFHTTESVPDTRVAHRPDTLYGLSKCFTEDLASLYWDKYQIETVCLRICSCFSEPQDRRQLFSFMSYDDCVRLVEAALTAPRVGHSIIYGTSDNRGRVVSNVYATHIGYRPQDNTDAHFAKVQKAKPPLDPQEAQAKYVGGWFCDLKHPDDPDYNPDPPA